MITDYKKFDNTNSETSCTAFMLYNIGFCQTNEQADKLAQKLHDVLSRGGTVEYSEDTELGSFIEVVDEGVFYVVFPEYYWA